MTHQTSSSVRMGIDDVCKNDQLQAILTLKAALYTQGNQEKLIEQAVRAYAEEIQLQEDCCFECNTDTHECIAEYKIPGGRNVVILGVPTMICPNCGHQEWDINVVAALEQFADRLPEHTTVDLTSLLTNREPF